MTPDNLEMLRGLTKAVASLRIEAGSAVQVPESELKLRQIFRDLDKDNSGYLDREEIALLAKRSGVELTDAQLDEALTVMDKDGDGIVDFPEFMSWWRLGTNGIAATAQYQVKVRQQTAERAAKRVTEQVLADILGQLGEGLTLDDMLDIDQDLQFMQSHFSYI